MINLKSIKNQKGFTLVEVIVVAIIVAALAGVAIPMYTSYVTSSRQNAAANAAGSIASFMGSCINQSGTVAPTDITAGTETDGTKSASLSCDASTPPTTMQLPVGFKFIITEMDTTGHVRAIHIDSDDKDSAHYNY